MSRKVYSFLVAKRILLGLGAVACLFFLASPSSAKAARTSDAARANPANAVVFTGDQRALKIVNAADRRAQLVRFLHNAGVDPKSVKVVSKSCGCPMAGQNALGFGSCLQNCMKDAGVSAVTLIMCGASCAAAETGIGAIVCAICVGVDVTVVTVCAMGCIAYPKAYNYGYTRNSVVPPDPGLKQAYRAVKTAVAYS